MRGQGPRWCLPVRAPTRRLRRIEERLGPSLPTEADRPLRERIEAGRRRFAEAAASRNVIRLIPAGARFTTNPATKEAFPL